jgi:hypothetical protein
MYIGQEGQAGQALMGGGVIREKRGVRKLMAPIALSLWSRG